ncbi:carboxylesterase family protein [Amycolatopsis pigmentata]|uniref:Carboxylesterase family protein n=1 Tax=Amycolatopsis pigmentata TaxID=450801 RepID=A0ABW5FLA0_9PSEU
MNIEVETGQGTVRGALGDGVVSFKGIPFAAAPVGDLRFAPPAEPLPWDGVRDATRYGAISLRRLEPLSAVIPGVGFLPPGRRAGRGHCGMTEPVLPSRKTSSSSR